jgi:lysozyme family protein
MMTENNFECCLDLVLSSEGGYSDNKSDPGGATNLGVTKRVWEEWVKCAVTKGEIKALTPEMVAPLYRKKYWDVCKCDDLPSGLDYLVFDIAVNSGTGRAAKFLQSAVGATPDGVIGNGTLTCVKRTTLSTRELINIICDRRELFYKGLAQFNVFGKGWLRRNEDVRKRAIDMLAAV